MAAPVASRDFFTTPFATGWPKMCRWMWHRKQTWGASTSPRPAPRLRSARQEWRKSIKSQHSQGRLHDSRRDGGALPRSAVEINAGLKSAQIDAVLIRILPVRLKDEA